MSDAPTSHDSTRRGPARQNVDEAMEEVAHYRHQYLRAAQAGESDNLELRREFHSAVLNYWLSLRPYRNTDALGQKWQEAQLWKDDANEWVTGLDNLQDWVNRTRTVTVAGEGGHERGEPETRTVSEPLPAKALLRVSMILDDLASQIDDEAARKKGRVEIAEGGDAE